MEAKKCPRCGKFHNSEELVCQNCEVKEKEELKRIIDYMDEGSLNYCLLNKEDEKFNEIFLDISNKTQISQPTLGRYLDTYLKPKIENIKSDDLDGGYNG